MSAILLLDSHADELGAVLRQWAPELELYFVTDDDGTAPRCDIWLGEPDRAAALLAQGHKPIWLQSTWAGFKPLLAASLPKDYRLSRAVGVFGQSIAEYALAHMLSHEQRCHALRAHQRRRVWSRQLPGSLAGKCVLIVGAGDIGCDVGAFLQPFGVTLHAIVNTPRPLPGFARVDALDALPQAVADADYVINILPDTPKTRDIYDAALLARMKSCALFINVGRGTAVVDDDLIAVLPHRQLSGAVLDVFRQEPLPGEHPFWTTENLTITPHIAGPLVPVRMGELFLANLRRYRQGEALRGEVDFTREY